MDDRKIVKLLFDRAEAALSALSKKYGGTLFRIAMNILENVQDAQECVNDTYLALWNAIPPKEPNPLSAYTYRTGRNIALKRLRTNTAQRRNSRYDLSLEELAGCIPSSALEEAIDARSLGQAIDRFLDTVSQDSRIIFLRRYWFGDSIKDIAYRMGMQENAVSVRLSRTRTTLKNYLEMEGFSL